MRLNTLLPAMIAVAFVSMLPAPQPAMAVVPTPIAQSAFGNVAFAAGQVNAAGNGYTVTRQGTGRYTITYNTPFATTPRLVIDPVQTSIGDSPFDQDMNGINDWVVIANGGTDAFQIRCRITTASATGFVIEIGSILASSETCTFVIDEFGNVTEQCTFTALSRADLPFSFAAFGNNCVADLVPNQTVNVSDLLAVINAWGPCANPSKCPPDIAPPSGNDVVNVADLLAVINAWGQCP